jgi:group I intron endonuclease
MEEIKSGIYKILNLLTGDFYIGSTVNFNIRKYNHYKDLRKNLHYNSHLQNAWNKYGEENFKFEIVEIVKEKKQLIIKEQYYLDIYNPNYNICKIAGNTLGRICSEETKNKIRSKHVGKKASSEFKEKARENMIRRNLRAENHPLYGRIGKDAVWFEKHHTDETKKKISDMKCGDKSTTAKLDWEKVNQIRNLYKTDKYTHRQLAEMYGVKKTTIYCILNNISWKVENG